MPELPEVETIVREMQGLNLIGTRIVRATIFWPRSIATPQSQELDQQIKNQKILEIHRRGKFLVFTLSKDTLLVHLRMTGKFLLNKEETVTSHERVRLYLQDGRILHYEDQRKFGKWYLTVFPEKIWDKLGMEPLSSEFTLLKFEQLLKSHQRSIKPFLLDQRYIVGLGNIYVDEALWEAKIHPLRLTNTLTKKEMLALFQAIPLVLQKGIDNIGTSLGAKRANYFSVSGRRGSNQYKLNVFRRNGLPCPRCHTKLIKMTVAQRGTHLCPKCQHLSYS